MILQKLILKDFVEETILLEKYGINAEQMDQIRELQKNEQMEQALHVIRTEKLFGRFRNSRFPGTGREGVLFEKNGIFKIDTFQNSFSTGKWKKYTIVENLFLELELQGHFSIKLCHAVCQPEKHGHASEKKMKRETLRRETVHAPERTRVRLDYGALAENGIFYAEIKALSDGAQLYSGYYGTEDLAPTQPVKLAIDICTFKREKYVARNMKILKRDILENPDSCCYGKVWVHISDNASSLDGIVDTQDHITVDKNENLGGVGGFTRGIIETKKLQKEQGFTHVLLMDDDASISTAAVEANYMLLSYLKPEYFGHTVGGKLMVLDAPFVQFEVGAAWARGRIEAFKNGWDMRHAENVADSENESDPVEYQGWWYCCIPLSEIDDNDLPLPIFIHRDDVEYGLRTGRGRFIFMNRICIWHEAFAGKMPGMLDYYDIRNQAIVNAIQCPDYSKREFMKFVGMWMLKNLLKYRYRYLDYNLKAVEDFCKGADWLMDVDAGQLHRDLLGMNYKMKPMEEFVGLHGFTESDAKDREHGYWQPPFLEYLFYKLTLNGQFFPPKSEKIVVTAPYGSVFRFYRRNRIIVCDQFGNGLYLERSNQEFRKGLVKIWKALRLIDRDYDRAVQSYQKDYRTLVSMDYWKNYLHLEEQ